MNKESLIKYFKEFKIEILIGFILIFSISIIKHLKDSNAFEESFYIARSISILEDGDFNIINQPVREETKWAVTKTYNHTSQHKPGPAVTYLPIQIYNKLIGRSYSDELKNHQGVIVTNIILLTFAFFFIYKIFKLLEIVSFKRSLFFTFFSTPIAYYSIFEPTNPNITSVLFTTLLTYYFLLYSKKDFTTIKALNLFLLFIIASLIRVEAIFFGLPLVLLTIIKLKKIKKVLLATSPLIIFMILNLMQEATRGGNGVAILFYLQGPENILRYLFSPNGLLYITPMYGLVIIATFLLMRAHKDIWLKIFLFIPISLFVTIYSNILSINEGITCRHLITFFPVVIIPIGYLVDKITSKQKSVQLGFYLILSMILLWHWAMIMTHMISQKWWEVGFYYKSIEELLYLIPHFQNYVKFPSLQEFTALFINSLLYIPIILLTLFIFRRLRIKRSSNSKHILITSLCSVMFFTFIYCLDFYNNPINTEKMKRQGLFTNKVVFSNASAYLYDDHTEVVRKRICFNKKRGETNQNVPLVKKYKHFLRVVEASIAKDPISFKKKLSQGKIRRSYYEPNQEELKDSDELTCYK